MSHLVFEEGEESPTEDPFEYQKKQAELEFQRQLAEKERQAKREFQTELLTREREERLQYTRRTKKAKRVYRRRTGGLHGFGRWERGERRKFEYGMVKFKRESAKRFFGELKAWKVTAKGKFALEIQKETEKYRKAKARDVWTRKHIESMWRDIWVYRHQQFIVEASEDYWRAVNKWKSEQQAAQLRKQKKMWKLQEKKWAYGYYEKFLEPTFTVQEAPMPSLATQLGYSRVMRGLEEKKHLFRVYETEASPEFKESVKFYTGIGYPKLAGKYAPFPIPEDYTVETLKETPKGLKVALTPTRKPAKGIAETIMGWDLPSLHLREKLLPLPFQTAVPRPKPLGFLAAPIATVERPVYTLGRLAGFETPKIPHTYTLEYGAEYATGTILTELYIGLGIGKVLGKIWSVAPKIVKAPLTKVGGAIGKVAKPLTSRVEPWLAKIALQPHEYVAPGVVSVPSHSIMQVPEVSSAIWEMGVTQKTSLLFLEKAVRPTTKFIPSYFIRGTAMVPLATHLVEAAYKPMPEDWLLSAPKQIGVQTQVTIAKVMPYIPSTVSKGVSFSFPFILPSVISTPTKTTTAFVPKLGKSNIAKMFITPFPLQRLKLGLFERPTLRKKQKIAPLLTPMFSMKPFAFEELIPKMKVSMMQQVKPKMKMVQTQKLLVRMTPPRTIQKTVKPPVAWRSRKRKGETRKGLDLYGEWFFKEHPLPHLFKKRGRGG